MKTTQLILKAFVYLFFILFVETGFAQNVGISSSTGFVPDASAGLDVSYTNKGLLMPRVALTATNAAGPIASPAVSLLVYNTATAGTSPNNVVPGYYYWNGTAWNLLNTSAQTTNLAWTTTGNTGTTAGTNFIGTIDSTDFVIKTKNLERARITGTGNFAIGSTAFNATNPEKLLVDAGTTSSVNVINGKGNLNNYLQMNIQNLNAGTGASSDLVATADNGNESVNFIDMGINSSANTSTGAIGGANTAYIYSTGNDFAIGNGTANKSVIFFTGGTSASTYTERFRLDATGRVGIGTSTPGSDLTLNQSSGVGGTKGFRFAGNSIGGTNSGTGFIMTLGYNVAGNKQLWLGDPDYANNVAGTFLRFSGGGTGLPTFDAVAGDNSVRRYIALGTGGDANAGVILGGDGNVTSPSSNIWGNGNMAIGNGYRANAAPTNGLLVQGNVGIGTVNPATKLHIFGANPLTLSGVVTGTSTAADSLLTITNGLVRKLPTSTFISATNTWSTIGNTGTTAGTNFIGTTDAVDFVVKTNNTEKARVSSTGSFGIGSSAFNATNPERLLVDAGASSYNVISGKGNINSYLQLNIQNTNAGAGASSDVVATNDYGTEANGLDFIDMGVNSSANTSTGVIGGANTAYLYSTGNDLAIGNATAGKNLLFFTGGTSANERIRIDGNGNMGIGTTAPAQKLDVNGSINASSSVISQGSVFVDAAISNTGALSPGLILGGVGSGETISSKRTAGTNQYGIDFYTAGNNRMTIANGGNVGIGTNTPGYKLTVAGIVAPTADNLYSLGGGTTNRWTAVYATNGTIQTSDRRLKTNIKNLNYGLKEVLAMQPVSYNWKEKPSTDHKIGLIAQDVRKLVPEVVTGDEAKEKLGMNYAELVPVLINAIKEQQKEIDDLKKAVQKRH